MMPVNVAVQIRDAVAHACSKFLVKARRPIREGGQVPVRFSVPQNVVSRSISLNNDAIKRRGTSGAAESTQSADHRKVCDNPMLGMDEQ
jgi:hypothetical protein